MDLSLFNLLFLLFIHKLPYAISRGIIDTFARAILTFSENTGEPTGRSSNGFPSAWWSKFSSNGFVLSAYSIFSSSSRKGLRPFFCEKKGLNHQKLQRKIFANVQISSTNLVKGFELAHVDEWATLWEEGREEERRGRVARQWKAKHEVSRL